MKRKTVAVCVLALFGAAMLTIRLQAQAKAPLRLVETIPMPDVHGRMDHLDVDVKGERLFVSDLGGNTVQVIDLRAGKWLRSIAGPKVPQGNWFVPSLNRLFVASGGDGMLRIYNGSTFKLIKSLHLGLGANRIMYDPARERIYVGYGIYKAGEKIPGGVAMINARTGALIGTIQVAGHPAEILLNRTGTRLYVFVIPPENAVQVVDVRRRKVIATWPVSSTGPGDGAIDYATHRLFIGTQNPSEMIVMDSRTGKQVAALPTGAAMDGVFFDARLKRIYVSCGRLLTGYGRPLGAKQGAGFVYVYQQHDADHYSFIGKVPTRAGSGTSFWSPQLNRYYVAAPAMGKKNGAILVFEPVP